MTEVLSRKAAVEELNLLHSPEHIDLIQAACAAPEDLEQIGNQFVSVYLHPSTFKCASIAVGSTLQALDSVLKGDHRSGICVVRPPGHHAKPDHPNGFCIFNNVALAAQRAIDSGLKR